MSTNTGIPYVHHTFNPWWGCVKLGDECVNCYAEKVAHRFTPGLWGPHGWRRFFSRDHWDEPFRWNRQAYKRGEIHRVLCGSMCDLFERPANKETARRMDDTWLDLIHVIEVTQNLFWLLLTKRPEAAADHWPLHWNNCRFLNFGLGVTVCSRLTQERMVQALDLRAGLHFVSYEPALGPLYWHELFASHFRHPSGRRIDWVIAGCESGTKRRPANLKWFREARDAAKAFNVSFYLKQLETFGRVRSEPYLDGRQHLEIPEVCR